MKKYFFFTTLAMTLFLGSCSQLDNFVDGITLIKDKQDKDETVQENKTVKSKKGVKTQAKKPSIKKVVKRKKTKEAPKEDKDNPHLSKQIRQYCKKIDKKFLHWGWGLSGCKDYHWHHVRNSVKGDPLMWVVFGDEAEHRVKPKEMTMILCGVHGDEITPIKFCFDVLEYLDENFHKMGDDKLVVVSPIVSPDSFFKKRPTRTNARGVDINRNFPTKDWKKDALRLWKTRYRSDKRRYPGKHALSEPETLYQVNLIKRYDPNKIISVHAPLTILDYDGPRNNDHHGGIIGSRANQLLIRMSEKAKGYNVRNYPFFPGSLGNYAGNERHIPTYTLELPSSDNRKHKKYWNLFRESIRAAITHDMSKDIELADADKED